MKYTPQLFPFRDSLGNVQHVGVRYDNSSKTYVGEIRRGIPRKMCNGTMNTPVAATGEARTVSGCVSATINNLTNPN